MRSGRRFTIAIAVLIVLAIGVGVARWYQTTHAAPGPSTAQGVMAIVTNGNDRGPGSLREALFVVASAKEAATISIQTRKIALETALPPIVAARGLTIKSEPTGAEIDARALTGTAVLDVNGANVSIEGILIRNCSAAAILLRADRFRLQASTVDSCDVGVEVAENATEMLIERSRFSNNRIGVRLSASTRNTSVVKNEFTGNKDAGLWAVRSAPDANASAISVRDNRFSEGRNSMVVGNVSLLIERNELINAREAAIHVVGAGAIVKGNRITGGAAMGIVVENARNAIIEDNEIDGLAAYGVMVRGSANTLVRSNRMHNCGYGMAFVLGADGGPSTAVENTIIGPKFNGIDVIGDSPILRRNQVLRPRARALHVQDFRHPDGRKESSKPFLDNNTFGAPEPAVAADARPAVQNPASAR
jgi:parallel beta-helix repeat protein